MESIAMIFVIAFLAALAKIMLLAKLGILRKALGFEFLIDLFAGTMFGWAFFGTLTGMCIGLMASLFFSGMIWIMGRIVGADTLTWRGWKRRPGWFEKVPPIQTTRVRTRAWRVLFG